MLFLVSAQEKPCRTGLVVKKPVFVTAEPSNKGFGMRVTQSGHISGWTGMMISLKK